MHGAADAGAGVQVCGSFLRRGGRGGVAEGEVGAALGEALADLVAHASTAAGDQGDATVQIQHRYFGRQTQRKLVRPLQTNAAPLPRKAATGYGTPSRCAEPFSTSQLTVNEPRDETWKRQQRPKLGAAWPNT